MRARSSPKPLRVEVSPFRYKSHVNVNKTTYFLDYTFTGSYCKLLVYELVKTTYRIGDYRDGPETLTLNIVRSPDVLLGGDTGRMVSYPEKAAGKDPFVWIAIPRGVDRAPNLKQYDDEPSVPRSPRKLCVGAHQYAAAVLVLGSVSCLVWLGRRTSHIARLPGHDCMNCGS